MHASALRRFPYPYRAALTICNDADLLTVQSFRRLHRYLNTTESTPWGKGLQLPLGQSFFLFRSPESPNRFSLFDGLSSRLGRDASFMLECARGGLLDVLHTYGCFTRAEDFSRRLAKGGLDTLERHGVKIEVWVNHGQPTNVQCLGPASAWMVGDVVGSPYYHSDLTLEYGIRWVWTGSEWTDSIALDAGNPRRARVEVGRSVLRDVRRRRWKRGGSSPTMQPG